MHSRQVVHRDLKPENMLFSASINNSNNNNNANFNTTSNTEIKIIDFGLSRKFNE